MLTYENNVFIQCEKKGSKAKDMIYSFFFFFLRCTINALAKPVKKKEKKERKNLQPTKTGERV